MQIILLVQKVLLEVHLLTRLLYFQKGKLEKSKKIIKKNRKSNFCLLLFVLSLICYLLINCLNLSKLNYFNTTIFIVLQLTILNKRLS